MHAETVDEIPNDRWVRVMCDHCADGIWNRNGSAAALEDLPVAAVVKERLRAWQDAFERHEASGGLDSDCLRAFAEEGRDIARAIKHALPDWTVLYFDEHAFRLADETTDRSSYEYPILDC